jgi:hypothetical protein
MPVPAARTRTCRCFELRRTRRFRDRARALHGALDPLRQAPWLSETLRAAFVASRPGRLEPPRQARQQQPQPLAARDQEGLDGRPGTSSCARLPLCSPALALPRLSAAPSQAAMPARMRSAQQQPARGAPGCSCSTVSGAQQRRRTHCCCCARLAGGWGLLHTLLRPRQEGPVNRAAVCVASWARGAATRLRDAAVSWPPATPAAPAMGSGSRRRSSSLLEEAHTDGGWAVTLAAGLWQEQQRQP